MKEPDWNDIADRLIHSDDDGPSAMDTVDALQSAYALGKSHAVGRAPDTLPHHAADLFRAVKSGDMAIGRFNNELKAVFASGKRRATEWRPIEDAPRDGTLVIVTGWHYGDPESKARWYCVSKWSTDFGHWCADPEDEDANSAFHDPTHFQHVSPAPEPKS